MNTRTVLAFLVSAALVHFAPGQASAQQRDSAQLRSDCRLAAQIITTGHPSPHREWAWEYIGRCRDSAAVVLASVWSQRLAADVDNGTLWRTTYSERDARVTRAVLAAIRDESRGRATRLVGIRVLASHAVPSLMVTSGDLAAIEGDSIRQVVLGAVSHSDVREGSEPVTPLLVREIVETLTRLGQVDADLEVRRAARNVALQLRMRTLP